MKVTNKMYSEILKEKRKASYDELIQATIRAERAFHEAYCKFAANTKSQEAYDVFQKRMCEHAQIGNLRLHSVQDAYEKRKK